MLSGFGGLGELGSGGFVIKFFAFLDAGSGVAVVAEGGEEGGIFWRVVDGNLGLVEKAVDALSFWHEEG